MMYVISHPRSGNSAFRYMLEMMTKRPTDGVCPGAEINPKDILQQPLIFKNSTDFIAKKSHDFKGVRVEDFVFFIIRDPLECTIRHNEQKRGIKYDQMIGYLRSWFNLLMQFDIHNNGVCLYYDAIERIGMNESKMIYPNPQSRGEHWHKAKLGAENVKNLKTWMVNTYPVLFDKYVKDKINGY